MLWPQPCIPPVRASSAFQPSPGSIRFTTSTALLLAATTPLTVQTGCFNAMATRLCGACLPAPTRPPHPFPLCSSSPGLLPVPLRTRHPSSLRPFAHAVSGMQFLFPSPLPASPTHTLTNYLLPTLYFSGGKKKKSLPQRHLLWAPNQGWSLCTPHSTLSWCLYNYEVILTIFLPHPRTVSSGRQGLAALLAVKSPAPGTR